MKINENTTVKEVSEKTKSITAHIGRMTIPSSQIGFNKNTSNTNNLNTSKIETYKNTEAEPMSIKILRKMNTNR